MQACQGKGFRTSTNYCCCPFLVLQLLGSSTVGSDLEQLAAFDEEVQHLLQQQAKRPAAASARPARPAAESARVRDIQQPGPAVQQAAAAVGLPAAISVGDIQQQIKAQLPAATAAAAEQQAAAPTRTSELEVRHELLTSAATLLNMTYFAPSSFATQPGASSFSSGHRLNCIQLDFMADTTTR